MKSYFGVSGPITFNPIYICKLGETINEPILNVITFSISCNLNITIVLILFVCGHRPEELLEFSMFMLTHLPEKTSKYWRCFITQATFIVFLKRHSLNYITFITERRSSHQALLLLRSGRQNGDQRV